MSAFSSWRGMVGQVHPTLRPGATEEVIRLLPEGIGLLSLHLDIRRGTEDEFATVMAGYERELAKLVDHGCEVLHPSGAPPFMVHGHAGEAKIIAAWEKKFKTPIFTSGQNQVNALKALKVKRIVGATYFSGKINELFSRYFEDAGFSVLSMDGMDVPFNKVQELAAEQVYAHIKKSFLKQKKADAIYMLGSGWRTLGIVQMLENDLEVPVLHPVPARVWEIQKRLHINEPRKGYGRLLETMPSLP